MITLPEFLNTIDYKITGGSEYQWESYGPNARYIDSDNTTYSINAVYDSTTQFVYAVEAWDYANNRSYRWISPEYIDAYKAECNEKNIEFDNACDELSFIDLEVADDMLEKAAAIVAGVEYDTRVKVPIDLPKEELFQLMMTAHERDITLNELVIEALQEAIDSYHKDPEKMKLKAAEFVKDR
jgi:hypothetical protein